MEEKLKHSRFEASETVIELKAENEIQMASIAKRDRIYRRLISDLTLSDKHKKDLMNRGLSEKEIESLLPDNINWGERKVTSILEDLRKSSIYFIKRSLNEV